MLFRSSRYNRQLEKLIDAEINIKEVIEHKTRLISVKDKNDEQLKELKEIENTRKLLENKTKSLQDEKITCLRQMENTSRDINQIKDKSTLGTVGAFFNSDYRKLRRTMRNLKNRNKLVKKQMKQVYKEMKENKKQEKKAIKRFHKFEEFIVKLGKEKKYEVKFINYFYRHERKIGKNCSKEEIAEIRKCVKSMQNDVKLENSDKTPKELFELLKDVSKGKKRKLNIKFVSPYQEKPTTDEEHTTDEGQTQEDQTPKGLPPKGPTQEDPTPKGPTQEDPTPKGPTQEDQPTDEDPTPKGPTQEDPTPKGPTQEDQPTDGEPTPEEHTTDGEPTPEGHTTDGDQTTDETPKGEKSLRDQVKFDSIFLNRAGEAIINGQILGMAIQRFRQENKAEDDITPDEYAYYIGRNGSERLSISDVKREYKTDEKVEEFKIAGLETLEKMKLMIDGDKKIDWEKLARNEKAAYSMLKKYYGPIQQKKIEAEQEIGGNPTGGHEK